jgi:threonine dehydrogenase-like Zn-dependent dehydrogenase
MIPTKAYAVLNATGDPTPWSFQRRDPGPPEILIDIHSCGICHTDIHQARNEWGNAVYASGGIRSFKCNISSPLDEVGSSTRCDAGQRADSKGTMMTAQ